jgi:hypothetical protein
MKKITLKQMELIEGGSTRGNVECGLAIVGMGIAYVSLVTPTGGLGLALGAIGWSIAPVATALSCLK